MTDTQQEAAVSPIAWDAVTPTFSDRLRAPKKPERPSDGAIALAQKSYAGEVRGEGDAKETVHVLRHRFKTVEEAEKAADELKRAGYYTTPESTVTVVHDPDNTGDRRLIAWQAGNKRGRKSS